MTQQEARLAGDCRDDVLASIDGLTPDECLAQYERIQREEASPTSLTHKQLYVARALWSHDVRVAVKKALR